MKMTAFVVAVGLMVGGCVQPAVYITMLGASPEPRSSPRELRVVTSPQGLDRPFRELALIVVDDKGTNKSETQLLELAMDEARSLGADALILLTGQTSTAGVVPVGWILLPVDRRIVRATEVVFTDD